ncbi:nuclear pore complex protein Nup107 [Lutzomyia longipalpis]|uniref:nuclear pore complex protein Nup107 n=1 Tax=Lutzomyia longipalpis TaxID=7200 RepID=UPI002483F170|nr:nuclear pore complex protein Nup107 [Lutzomyia longipalpis]
MNLSDYTMMDDSFVLSRKGLIRKKESGPFEESFSTNTDGNASVSLANTEIRKLLEEDRMKQMKGVKQYIGRIFDGLDGEKAESVAGSTRMRSEQLYTQFLEVLHGRTNDAELFETIQDLIQTCTDTLDEMQTQSRRVYDRSGVSEDIQGLQMERNVWRLIYSLYRDRVIVQKEAMDCDDIPLGGSEKTIVEHLYASNSNLREYQLIVDWLELCSLEQTSVKVGHFTDHTVAWENTLHQLQNANQNTNSTAFRSTRETVESLDPDAPVRERKPLHDFDVEDQQRLMRDVFLKIRQGRIEEAQSLCEHCGQPWQAAILEGWRLHHDPNYEVLGGATEKAQIEGNPRRDAWKKFAWKMADSRLGDEYTRAIVGVLSGHLDSLMMLPDQSWMDLIWAYLKVQIDIRVESEIRDCSLKSYIAMPDGYWKGKVSLEQIFENISAHRSERIRREADDYMNTVVKYIILDNVADLMGNINEWLAREKLNGQTLRFLAHLVLFMRQIGRSHREDVADRVVKAYVEWLFTTKDPRLVAFYTATLPSDMQIMLFSKFLRQIADSEERQRCAEEAMKAGLDVGAIATITVRHILQEEDENTKISALEWLTFYPQHRAELLWQGNTLIRSLIAARKVEAVREAIEVIPGDSLEVLVQQFGTREDIPWREECAMKEYLCHKTYLAAIDGFNAWTHLFHSRPKEPQEVPGTGNFTERVAQQEREKIYKAELQQWKEALGEQTKETRDLLYNILLFPDHGWLVDPECLDSVEISDKRDWELRAVQMDALRRLCIPEIVLLLHKVLHLSGEYRECIRLVDELASEQHQLYQLFPQHKLAEVLTKVAESSLALMNDKCDSWGFSTM